MELSTSTSALLDDLEALSGNGLRRRTDLGVLMEIALRGGSADLLGQLSFTAKFLSRTYGIMERIGRDATGYANLEHEFRVNTEKGRRLLTMLVSTAPLDVRHHVSTAYLAMRPESLQNFLSLCHDLSWYKNWLIDHPEGPS